MPAQLCSACLVNCSPLLCSSSIKEAPRGTICFFNLWINHISFNLLSSFSPHSKTSACLFGVNLWFPEANTDNCQGNCMHINTQNSPVSSGWWHLQVIKIWGKGVFWVTSENYYTNPKKEYQGLNAFIFSLIKGLGGFLFPLLFSFLK